MLPILTTALAPLDLSAAAVDATRPIKVEFPTADDQPFCDDGATLLAQSGVLLAAYKHVSQRPVPASRHHDMVTTFQKDRTVAKSTIEAGKRWAIQDVEYLLADKHHETRGRSNLTEEDKQRGRMLMKRGADKQSTTPVIGLGVVTHDLNEAVGKMANIVE